MYQSVGSETLHLYAEAMQLPLHRKTISGKPIYTDMSYSTPPVIMIDSENPKNVYDEVEDLFSLLQDLVKLYQADAVSVGAIFSDYQRLRVENVCQRLNIKMLAYLWHRDQKELLQEMIDSDLSAILIKVSKIYRKSGFCWIFTTLNSRKIHF